MLTQKSPIKKPFIVMLFLACLVIVLGFLSLPDPDQVGRRDTGDREKK